MNPEGAMTRCLKVLPLLAALLAACSRPSPLDEIVAANIAARGGMDRIKALNSIRETGTVTAPGGRVAKVVREIKRPGMFRLELTYQGTKSVFANDGAQGWQVAPLQGQFEPKEAPPAADSAADADQRDIEGSLVDWRAKGNVVELLGREQLPTGAADKLKITLKGGAVRTDYVDAATHQVVRSDFERTVRGHRVQVQATFSDFRSEGGLVFPHLIVSRVKDRPQELKITVEKIELNPDLPDALFKLPK